MKFSLPVPIKKILSNKTSLYVVFAVALLQWIYLLTINRFDLIIIFGLMSFVIYKLNRNMILVLGIPLLIIWIKLQYKIEGFEGGSDEASSGAAATSSEGETTETTTTTETDAKKTPRAATVSTEKKKETKKPAEIISPAPASHNEEEHETTENADPEFDSNQINYASTLTQNMKSYNDILGSDGFAKMSQDTQQLLIQQEQLGNAMKQFAPLIGQMTPFLEKATGLLNNMDMKQINNMANMFKKQ